jgi:DHA3 family macrolide efflux protein-like MFS transporter
MEKAPRFFNRNYVLFFQGQVVSRLGKQVAAMVANIWLAEATQSASLMGLMSTLAGVTSVALGLVGGTVADRASRRRIIVLCDALSGITGLLLAALFYLFPHENGLWAAGIISAAVIISVATSFSEPAMGAAIPDLVPRNTVARANSLGQFSMQSTMLLGMALGGHLFTMLGVFWTYLLNGFSYLYASISTSVITIPQHIPERQEGWKARLREFQQDTRAGFIYIWKVPGLRRLVLASALVSFFTAPLMLLFVFYVKDFLGASEQWYGYILAAFAVGSMLGYAAAGIFMVRGRVRTWSTLGCMLMVNAGFGLLAFVHEPMAALILVFVGGALSGFAMVNTVTILQLTTPSEARGRIFGVLGTISGSLAPVGAGLGTVFFDAIGQSIPITYLGCAGVMIAIVLWMASSSEVRDFLAFEPGSEEKSINLESTKQAEAT